MQINRHILTLNDQIGRLKSFLESRLSDEALKEGLCMMDEMWSSFFKLSFELEQATLELEQIKNHQTHLVQELYEPTVKAQEGTRWLDAEDIALVDTSFFRTDKYSLALCEQKLRDELLAAQSKADACKRIMLLDTLGYLSLRGENDERKAQLVNPFSAPKFVFTRDDFRKARKK